MDGLVPPSAGFLWQPTQLFMLKLGPRPTPSSPGMVPETELTSLKFPWAEVKAASCVTFRPGSGPPAPGAPPRTPGSTCAKAMKPTMKMPPAILSEQFSETRRYTFPSFSFGKQHLSGSGRLRPSAAPTKRAAGSICKSYVKEK